MAEPLTGVCGRRGRIIRSKTRRRRVCRSEDRCDGRHEGDECGEAVWRAMWGTRSGFRGDLGVDGGGVLHSVGGGRGGRTGPGVRDDGDESGDGLDSSGGSDWQLEPAGERHGGEEPGVREVGELQRTGDGDVHAGSGNLVPSNPPTRLIGYAVTRSDHDMMGLDRPVISIGGNGDGLSFSGSGWFVENLSFKGGSISSMMSFSASAIPSGTAGSRDLRDRRSQRSNARVSFCEVTGVTAGVGFSMGNNVYLENNYVHDCAFVYFAMKLQANVVGVSESDCQRGEWPWDLGAVGGIQSIVFNTIHNAGGHGIWIANNPDITGLTMRGNLITKCGRYGIETRRRVWRDRRR